MNMDIQDERNKGKSCASMLTLFSLACLSFAGKGEVEVVPSGAHEFFPAGGGRNRGHLRTRTRGTRIWGDGVRCPGLPWPLVAKQTGNGYV